MQVQVQKLTSTTRPRNPPGSSGSELSHPVAPPKPASSPSSGSRAAALCRPAGARQEEFMIESSHRECSAVKSCCTPCKIASHAGLHDLQPEPGGGAVTSTDVIEEHPSSSLRERKKAE